MINVAQFKPNQFSIQFKHPYQQAIQFAQLQFETITIDAKTFRKFKPPLGEGSEGIVSKGQNVQTNENVAIKEYKSINKNELQAIQAIQRYKFKNIIGIIGVQERQNGLPVVVMEFAHGEFYQYMQTPQYQNLSYEEKNLCFIQMMEGLEQLHQLGLFHRDVKPENFVYVKGPTNEITIKLIDFGLVKENKENMFQTSKVGTPYYMAPEVFGNQNNSYDKSVDIWSLGAIWYELLTNDTFFQGNRQEEIFYKIVNISQEEINRQIQQNDSIKEKEKHFIKSMLQKVPSQRIQLKEVIQFYLNQFVTDLESFIKELQKKKREGLSEKLQNQQIKIRNELNQFKQISLDNVKKANQTEFKRKLKQFKEIERIEEKEVIKMQFYNQKEEEQKKIENLIYEKLLINDSQINQKIFQKSDDFSEKMEKEMDEIKKKSIQHLNYQMKNRNEETQQSILMQSEIQISDEMEQYIQQKEEELKNDYETFTEQEKGRVKEIVEESKNLELKLIEKLGREIEIAIHSWKKNEKEKEEQRKEQEKQQAIQDLEKQKEIQEFKDKQQLLLNLLGYIQTNHKIFIEKLIEKQKIITEINSPDKKKQELLTYINEQLQKHKEIILDNEEKYNLIQQAQTKEMLKEFNELTQENEQYQKFLMVIIERITQEQGLLENQVTEKKNLDEQKKQQELRMKIEQEQKLRKEIEQYQSQFIKVKQQQHQQSSYIQKIQDQISFYNSKEIQMFIYGQEDAINYHQQITQVVQTVEFQEKRIQKDEALQQQIVTYQSYNSKLEEILQAQNRLKTHIEEANKSIQQTDKQFLDKHQSQIQELNDKLNDYQEKYQYFSTNQKYSIQITQVINQIGQAFCYLNNLKQLISQRTLPAYQQYTQIYSEIQQSLKSFEKQHSQLHQKIYNDEQIQLKNHERIKTLEMTKNQLDQFNQQMNQFKEQVKNLIKNEYCNNETTRNLINNKLKNMDQNIKEQNEQFDKFTQFNQEDKCENIDEQIKQLEEFQGKLKELKGKEIEYLYQFELIIKNVGQENKSQQEKEILFLNNQLQTRHKEYAKALQQIKFSSQSVELFQQMNQQTESLQKELQYEILILDKLLENYKGNILLSAKTQRDMQTKNQKQSEKIQDLLKKFQKNCLKNGQKLENIITNVSQKKEFYFYPMDDKLIKNCEYLKIQEEELSIVLTSINQKIFTQQLTPQLLNELKEHILKVFADIDELMKKIPENNEIEEFNNHYIKNLESYEKVYALINYIKQYHSTRYQERIKEHANQQKLKQQNNKESDYQKQFYSKLNVDQEENTKKEKEAQDILLRYENVLFKNYNMMTIEAMQKDKIQIEKTTVELENYIKQKDLVKFRSKLKDQSKIKDIIQKYQIFELIQQKLFEEILQKQINQSGQSL